MTVVELLAVLACAAGGWFLWDSLKAREAANAAMRFRCQADGLYFLDDTVALKSLRFGRDHDGHLALRRSYRFAYSDSGVERYHGTVELIGSTVEALHLDSA